MQLRTSSGCLVSLTMMSCLACTAFHKFCVSVFVGADLSDYFNYGFNEDTWKAYCEKQKRLRMGMEVSTVSSITSKITVRDQCLLCPCFIVNALDMSLPFLFPSLSLSLSSVSWNQSSFLRGLTRNSSL